MSSDILDKSSVRWVMLTFHVQSVKFMPGIKDNLTVGEALAEIGELGPLHT
jgi:hypothetical protein